MEEYSQSDKVYDCGIAKMVCSICSLANIRLYVFTHASLISFPPSPSHLPFSSLFLPPLSLSLSQLGVPLCKALLAFGEERYTDVSQ